MSNVQPEEPSVDIHALPLTARVYKCGTLCYTLFGLWKLFFWILWGDFAFWSFENIFGKFTPLMLNEYKATPFLIANLGSIACVINLFLGPGISQWSDNCRTSWGRRRPFLAVAGPLAAFSVIMMGVSPEVGRFLYSISGKHLSHLISENGFILLCLCVFIAFFHYFNMVLCNAFNWFFRDVVPHEVVARMQAAMRALSIIAGILFNAYIFPHIMTDRIVLCVSIGALYSVAFLMMCWAVKEGDYPPVPVDPEKPSLGKLLEKYINYFRECLSVPIYRYYFLLLIINSCGFCAGAFGMLYQTNVLRLTLGDIGVLANWGLIVGLAATVVVGWACDKFNPFRVSIFSQIALCAVNIYAFLFSHDYRSYFIVNFLTNTINSGWGIGMGAMSIFVFPKDKFAQFSTATNVIPMGVCILGNFLVGGIFTLLNLSYQYMFVSFALGTGLSVIPLIIVYRMWRAYGGEHHYQAPPVPPLKPLWNLLGNKKAEG